MPFLTQGSNPGLLHCRQILYHLSHKGKRIIQPSDCSCGYLSQEHKNLYLHDIVCTNVSGSFIDNSSKLEQCEELTHWKRL